MKFSPTATVVAFLALGSTAVFAQDAIVQGSGYQVSENTVVHPSVGAQTGFDSNVFYEDGSTTGAGLLQLSGALTLAPMEDVSGKGGSPPDYTFTAGARFQYQEYLSSNPNVTSQRNLGLGADLELGLLQSGQFPVGIENHFIRTNRPTNFENNTTISRDINSLRAGIKYMPEGKNISGRLSYTNTVDYFEGESTFANRFLNEFKLGVDWQFLPITRFFVEGSYGLNSGLGANSTKISSQPMRGIAGVASAITESITVRAHGGYGIGAYSSGASYSTFLYHLEGGYRYSPVGRVRLIFDRDFQDSVNANFYGDYKLKLAVDQQIDRVMLQAHVTGILRNYQGGLVVDLGGGQAARDDVILSTGVAANLEVREWIAVNASYMLASVQTDYLSMADGEIDDPSFVRHQLMVGATAAF